MAARLPLVSWLGLLAGLAACGPPPDPAPAPSPAAAEVPVPTVDPSAVRFEHLTIEDGLSQNAVLSILQDRRGFLWLGTRDGLNRYDGYRFRVYRHDPFDPASLSGSVITALYEDADGALWVGTLTGGLNRLDPDTGEVVRYANVPRQFVRHLATDAAGSLWIGTVGEGVLRMDRADAARPDAPVERVGRGLAGAEAIAFLVDREDRFWALTDKALHRLDRDRDAFVRVAPGPDSDSDRAVRSLAEDSDGALWLGTPLGLRRVVGTSEGALASTLFPFPPPDPGDLERWVYELAVGPDGAVWFRTGRRIGRFDPDREAYRFVGHDPADPGSLGGDLPSALLWDRTGVLWVGTNGYGLDRYDAKRARFRTVLRPAGLASPASGFSIRALLDDGGGALWIGAGALYRYDLGRGALSVVDPRDLGLPALVGNEVTAMLRAQDGALWFASEGLHRYDPATGAARSYTYDPARPDGLARRTVAGVFEDRRGAIWAVTTNHISRLDDPGAGRFTHLRHTPDGLAEHISPSVHEAADGTFWIATEAGLVALDPATGAARRFRTDPTDPTSLSHDIVRVVQPDPAESDRVLWVGTAGGGLNRFDLEAETFTHVTEREGLPNNVVYAVLPDGAGRLWLSTNRGLARYDPRTGDVRVYDASDGLQSDEFNTGASHRAPDGRLVFGGIRGVSLFDPAAFADNPAPPPVVLTGLRVGDRPVAVGDSTGLLDRELWAADALRLSHRENMVTFSFAALDFSAPAKNRYAYRMEGFDDAWIRAGAARTATYTNLPPGRYTFRVRGSNNDGVWNREGAALAVAVAPPPWRAWWAYALYALALGAAVAAGGRYREQRRRLEQEAELARARAEALHALDRSKSEFFANVSHEFRTPLTLTLGPLDDVLGGAYGDVPAAAREPIALARRSAGRVLGLINQILDVARLEGGRMPLRARRLDLGAFAAAQLDAFAPLADRRRVEVGLVRPEAPVEVWADPEHVGTILSNLLSNAFKFTPEGGAVRVSVGADDGAARVAVRDSGPGIAAEDLPHVFDRFYQTAGGAGRALGSGIGLALASDLAALHGGALEAVSDPGFGSVFTLRLPLGAGHLAPDQRDDRPWEPPALPAPDLDEAPDAVEPGPPDDEPTVLVADDHPEIRAYVRRHLDAAGYRVIEAADGEEALAAVRERLPDLVVSDVMMPRLDGLGLCRALRASPETDFLPVLLLTAKAGPEDRLDGFAELCDDYLTKPFEVRELVARVDALIAIRRRLRERFAGPAGDGRDPADPPIATAEGAYLAALRSVIAESLADEGFDVAALAVAMGQSRGHLLRKTKALLGRTPSDLIRTARLDRAAALLEARAGTVSEVAYGVGFKSVAHFSNAFLAHTGVRPSSYARSDDPLGRG